jgi:RNA polymerase sigma-70 factor, ECF subfamily
MDDERCLPPGLARRERAAWSAVYDHHARDTFGVIYHLVGGNRHLAEELHQEVWLAALEGFDQFDASRGRFRDWLLGIARHRVSRHYRAAVLRSTEPAEKLTIKMNDAVQSPVDQLEGVERAGVVRAALIQLNRNKRDVLMKKYIDGLSVIDIAERTGRSVKSVESLLTRARERLRELVRPYFVCMNQGDRHEPADPKQP